jgi:putative ABC transport system permease protein
VVRLPGWDEDLRVVGVAAPRSDEILRTNDLGFDLEHPLYSGMAQRLLYSLGVPLVEDAWKRSDRCVWVLPRDAAVDWIFLRVPPEHVSASAKAALEAVRSGGKAALNLYALSFPILLGKQVDRFLAVDAALFLACLAMGAVVMTSLGLLTALRRRREISIRRVEGATTPDIAAQFLAEGLLLAVFGSALGVVLGLGLARLRVALEPVTGFAWRFPATQASIAVGVALVVGLLASLLPALRAAAVDPVEGLGDE